MNTYHKKIKTKNKYREFIKILNGVLQLTEREIDIVISLFLLEDELGKEHVKKVGLLNTYTRGVLKEREKMSKSNFSKVEHKLREKGVLIYHRKGSLIINPMFKPIDDEQGVKVTFILEYLNDKDHAAQNII